MKRISFTLCVILVQMLNNLCSGNREWITNDLGLDRPSSLPSAAPFDQNTFFELNLSDENALKNPEKLKYLSNYLKELQRYVAIMGKPRYGRDLTRQNKLANEDIVRTLLNKKRKYKILPF